MMDGSGNNKDWPTLSDSNVACAAAIKNKHRDNSKNRPGSKESSSVSRTNEEKGTSNKKTDVTDGANGLSTVSTSTYSKTGARKKQSGKTKWSPVHIDLPSFRDNRSERNYNESHKFASGRRYNNFESAHNIANGYDNCKGRAFRGGRGGGGGGRGQFRFRRETIVNSDSRRHNSFSQEVASSQGVNFNNGTPPFPEAVKEQIRRQIEYYFSTENLVKDTYLRCHMDEQGYADIKLISEFPRVKRLTRDMKLILNAVKESSHLEVSDDIKIRPVIDPLRWPLKRVVCEPSSFHTTDPLADLMAAHFYAMSIEPSVFQSCQIPGPKPHVPGEHLWSYIPVGDPDKNEALFCVNDVYPHVDSNCMGAAAVSLEIANGHVSPPEQHSPNSDFHCELTSQFIPNNYEIQNGTVVGAVPETHFLPNGVSDIASDSNFPNGQTCSSDQVLLPCNGEFSSHDLRIKTEESFHPLNGSYPNGDFENNASACESNGLECSSDLRHMSEIGAYDCFGSNGVIMYNSGGHYYVAHSTEVLASGTDSSDEKSTLHNKSPEPSR